MRSFRDLVVEEVRARPKLTRVELGVSLRPSFSTVMPLFAAERDCVEDPSQQCPKLQRFHVHSLASV